MNHGILLLNKPAGGTSAQWVRRIQRQFNVKKAGHGGTLDPMATGVLPLFFNRATKLTPLFLNATKTYEGAFKLGIETDTQDVTGTILKEGTTEVPTEKISEQMEQMQGPQEQTPPQYSAVKVKGRAAYKYARSGQFVALKKKEIQVFEFKLLKRDKDEVFFKIHCSKGTYVRTLCHDLGKRLSTVAAMSRLTRVKTGAFSLEASIGPDRLTAESLYEGPHWISMDEFEKGFTTA